MGLGALSSTDRSRPSDLRSAASAFLRSVMSRKVTTTPDTSSLDGDETGIAVKTAHDVSPSRRRIPIVVGGCGLPVTRALVTGYSAAGHGEPSSHRVSESQSCAYFFVISS